MRLPDRDSVVFALCLGCVSVALALAVSEFLGIWFARTERVTVPVFLAAAVWLFLRFITEEPDAPIRRAVPGIGTLLRYGDDWEGELALPVDGRELFVTLRIRDRPEGPTAGQVAAARRFADTFPKRRDELAGLLAERLSPAKFESIDLDKVSLEIDAAEQETVWFDTVGEFDVGYALTFTPDGPQLDAAD